MKQETRSVLFIYIFALAFSIFIYYKVSQLPETILNIFHIFAIMLLLISFIFFVLGIAGIIHFSLKHKKGLFTLIILTLSLVPILALNIFSLKLLIENYVGVGTGTLFLVVIVVISTLWDYIKEKNE